MSSNLQRIGLTLALLTWCLISQAHHSTAATYLTRERVQIRGTIVDFQFRNPHSFIHVLAPDDAGQPQRWAVECAGTAVLASEAISARTIRPGDVVIVTGHPGRVPADHRLLLLSIERPSDGWKWIPGWARPATP